MGTAEVIEKYKCQGCGALHDDPEEAMECCEPETVYVCSVCGIKAGRFGDTAYNCEPPDPDAPPPPPTAAELEAAGQMRFLP